MNRKEIRNHDDLLERPRICLYRYTEQLKWEVGVLLRIRSGLNFIYKGYIGNFKTYGEYIDTAVNAFDLLRRKLRAFESIGDEQPFWKVKDKDYGKTRKYYTYNQAEHWRVYGKDEVAPKRRIRNENHPFQEMNEEYVQEIISTLGYKTKEEWWNKEERYNCLLSSDQELWEKDIPRPEDQPGYELPADRQDHQLTHAEIMDRLPQILAEYSEDQEVDAASSQETSTIGV